jgi:hypothetical protein
MSQSDPTRVESCASPSVADELGREVERLRALADRLKAREIELAEMEASYPYLRQLALARLREEFDRTVPPLPDKDLPTIAKEDKALPPEAFIHELEPDGEGS